jgi:uncharacterized protein (UPF0248 family)
MQTIKELLNKIRWDKRQKPEEYQLGILDRFSKEVGFVPFSEIKSFEGQFLTLCKGDETVDIPLHRIRAVKKSGTVIWKR